MGTHGGKAAPSPTSQARRWLTSVVHSEQGKAVVRAACELLFEFILIFIFLKAYNIVRNQFGSLKVSAAYALRHAEQIIWAERVTGMFWEQEIQDLFLPFTTWIRMWNIFYGSAHMAVTVFVLLFLFGLKPRAYQRYRTVFVIMNILAIAGYAMYPLMPPRLLATCDGQYGGCVKRYRFVDTMEEYGGLWSWHDTHIAKASNHYAAMPSMHAGYSVWCALAMYEHSPILVRVRFIWWVYPMLTLYCIVVTGNHYFLDAVAGILCLLVALRTAHLMPKAGRGAMLSEDCTACGGTAKEGEELEPLLGATGGGGASAGDAPLKKGTEGVVFVTVVVDPQQGGKVGRADDVAVIRAQQRHHSAGAVNGCEARGNGNVCTLRVGGQPPCTIV